MALLLLCGCPTPSVVLAIDSYCEALKLARCERGKRCAQTDAAYDCSKVSLEGSDCLGQFRDSLAAKTLNYDAKAAQQCVDEVRASSCSGTPWNDGACREVVVGNSRQGEPCGACGHGLICAEPLVNGCGTCQPFAESPPLPKQGESCFGPEVDGRGCEADLGCTSFNGGPSTCQPRSAVGESCMPAGCVAGALCEQGTCVREPGLGDACSIECGGGLQCEAGVCRLARYLGESCARDADCLGFRCRQGVCTRFPGEGEACDGEFDCALPFGCVNGTCASLPAHGQACTDRCALPGECRNGVCVDKFQTCR